MQLEGKTMNKKNDNTDKTESNFTAKRPPKGVHVDYPAQPPRPKKEPRVKAGHVIALALAILGYFLLRHSEKIATNLGGALPPVVTGRAEPAKPAYDPADIERYNREVEDALVAYGKAIDAGAEAFGRRIGDGRAEFAAVRAGIPQAVKPYKTFKENRKLVTAVAKDRLRKTECTAELVRKDFMEPVFMPAMKAAASFDEAEARLREDLEDARQSAAERLAIAARNMPGLINAPVKNALEKRTEVVAKGCAKAVTTLAGAGVAIGVAGGIEAILIRQTVASVARLCARAAGKAAVSTAAPAADGPLPVGDIIAVGGFVWTGIDILRMRSKTPKELSKGLTAVVDRMEADALDAAKTRGKSDIDIYKAEIDAMRHAALAALETNR